ncbi:MAG: class I SAM-dependent methyltransferase [Planctomycetes bacterium]|nr:class I SAM-dependent methyltransferase [Planctomycetota bacterium]
MVEDLHRANPVGRFSGLAGDYAAHRPVYPDEAIDFIVARAGLGPSLLVVDIGAGTGISTRLFARRGLRVVGIEPNDEMRTQAEAESLPPPLASPTYRPGRAEATGLPDACAHLVLAAQAFHWFEPSAALGEFRRILKPDGWVALLWYERDESELCTAAFGATLRTAPDAARVEGPRMRAGEALADSPHVETVERAVFPHRQQLHRAGLLGRAFSVSYAPREPDAVEVFATALDAVFNRFQQDGFVTLHYHTTVHLARRRA